MENQEYMLEISHLCKYFELKGGLTLKASMTLAWKLSTVRSWVGGRIRLR